MQMNEPPLTDRRDKTKEHETYSLLIMISTPKKAEDMANYALANGAAGAFFSYARGTLPGHILAMLGLAGVRRELVVLAVPHRRAGSLLEEINETFNLKEKMGGIAYLLDLEHPLRRPAETDSDPYSVVAAIVNEGEGEEVVEHVRQSHPVGASILQASGSANHSRKTFDFEIVESKEIVLIITKKHLCKKVYQTIHDALRTELPGRGIIFSTDIGAVAGILEKDQELRSREEYPGGGYADAEQYPEDSYHPRDRHSEDGYEDAEPDDAGVLREGEPGRPGKTAEQGESYQVAVLALVDRGHTEEIVRLSEEAGGHGATIMRGRFASHKSHGFFSHSDETEKEAVIMIAPRETARTVLHRLQQYAAEHRERPVILTWVCVHSFDKFSYGTV